MPSIRMPASTRDLIVGYLASLPRASPGRRERRTMHDDDVAELVLASLHFARGAEVTT